MAPAAATSERKRWLLLLTCLLAAGGPVVGVGIASATRDFACIGLATGLILGIPFGLMAALGAAVFFIITRWLLVLTKWSVPRRRLAYLAPSAVFFLAVVGWAVADNRPAGRFQRHVQAPVPASVRDIRVAGVNSFLAKRWLLWFHLAPGDLQKIVNRQHLVESEPFDLREIVQRDVFLKQIPWGTSIPTPKPARFFKMRQKTEQSSSGVFLMYDPLTSQAWFLSSFQR